MRYYPEDEAPEVDKDDYKLEVGGLVDNKKPWTLDELYALPQETQITRHICVEGWSAIGKWTGVPLSRIPRARRRRHARQIRLVPAAPRAIPTSIDMATALHPQTQMTFKFDDQILPRKYGFPMKVPHADQARLQEPQIRHGDGGAPNNDPAATGRTRATTGSAELWTHQGCSVRRRHLGDQPRAALERDVVPQPRERDDEAVLTPIRK